MNRQEEIPEPKLDPKVEKLEKTKKLFLEIITGLPDGIGQQLIAHHFFYHEYRLKMYDLKPNRDYLQVDSTLRVHEGLVVEHKMKIDILVATYLHLGTREMAFELDHLCITTSRDSMYQLWNIMQEVLSNGGDSSVASF
ncbi:MAG TPA: hypothetical protein PKJ26_03615 [Candidatus Woesebacteria bacterium]|nr:hypothetical protein [Candidatus Woesebacteria bacterium]HNS65557.1 hypothetical protein [Candidatus Woesebacteria bacterium]